jgi:dedicator of cytokinesis protein 3
LIGIFPSSCVFVRPDASVDDGSLGAAYEMAIRRAQAGETKGPSWGNEMEAVKEEDEEEESQKVGSPRRDHEVERPPGVVDISGGPSENKRHSMGGSGRTRRPKSLILDRPPAGVDTSGEEEKEQPPLPRLTAGDSTTAGQQYPLVDEIACAIREWYSRLPTYLANREYRLFSTVTQHIDALFLGRRQLLAQTLSVDELRRVRRECVSRLVKCNVAQGLEVIVRSLEDGSVMVVEKDRAFAGATWIGGIPSYVYQVQVRNLTILSPL